MFPTPMRVYSDEKMGQLYRCALRVLAETGFRVDHETFLDRFESEGMKVDRSARRVCVTEDLVKRLLDPCPGKGKNLPIANTFGGAFDLGGSYPKYYDWATRRTRPGSTDLLLELLRTFGAVPQFKSVGRILTLTDVPQAIEPIAATALVIRHSPRPCGGEVYRADNIPYLVELGEIATGKPACTDYVPSCTFVVPPLKLTREEGEMILEKGRRGIPAYAGTMPSAGATSPVTREGTVVIELAEVIFIWLCYRLVNPAIKLGAICASSSFDMKEGACSFSSPEAVLQDCATVQILRDYFAADAQTACNYVDAKIPGPQTVYEKMFKTGWAYAFQGFAALSCGLLEAGQAFSPAQALLDLDMWQTCGALFRELPVDTDPVPFDEIHNVALTNGTFMDTESTLSLFRQVLHNPVFLDRSARRSDAQEAFAAAGLLDRAQARYEELKKAPLYTAPDTICRAVDKVVERARQTLR